MAGVKLPSNAKQSTGGIGSAIPYIIAQMDPSVRRRAICVVADHVPLAERREILEMLGLI